MFIFLLQISTQRVLIRGGNVLEAYRDILEKLRPLKSSKLLNTPFAIYPLVKINMYI